MGRGDGWVRSVYSDELRKRDYYTWAFLDRAKRLSTPLGEWYILIQSIFIVYMRWDRVVVSAIVLHV